jgi:hypothetical protein
LRTGIATGRRVPPFGKRAHRDTAPNRRADACSALALPIDLLTRVAQGAVDRGRTHAQQPGPDRRIKAQVPMSLHGIHQQGYQGLESLAAQPIGRFPQNDQRLPDRLVIQPVARADLARRIRPGGQHANGVLAVVLGEYCELVQDLASLILRRLAIALPNGCNQFLACRHADSPPHVVPLPPDHPTGSKLREATGQHG